MMKNSKLTDYISFGIMLSFIILVLSMVCHVSAVKQEYNNSSLTIYNILPNGDVTVVLQLNASSRTLITVETEGKVYNETILVLDERGLPLHFTLKSGKLTVYSGNSSKITIYYTTSNLTLTSNGITILSIHAKTQKSIIVLPENTGLIGFTGTPIIKYNDGRLTLEYNSPGSYKVEYITLNTIRAAERHEGNNLNTTIMIAVLALILASGLSLLAYYYLHQRREAKITATIEPSILDERDKMIIQELKRSGELSLSELARRLKLAKSTVHRRVMKLKKLGIVTLSEGYGKTVLVRLVKGEEEK